MKDDEDFVIQNGWFDNENKRIVFGGLIKTNICKKFLNSGSQIKLSN